MRPYIARAKRLFLWVSLVGTVVVALMIARNCLVRDEFQWGVGHTSMQAASADGTFRLNVETCLAYEAPPGFRHVALLNAEPLIGYWYEPDLLMTSSGQVVFDLQSCNFRIALGYARRGAIDGCIQLPLWFLELLCLIGPALWLRQRMHKLRTIPPQRPCTRCGYDTIGNVERCSECGEPLPVTEAAPVAMAESSPFPHSG